MTFEICQEGFYSRLQTLAQRLDPWRALAPEDGLYALAPEMREQLRAAVASRMVAQAMELTRLGYTEEQQKQLMDASEVQRFLLGMRDLGLWPLPATQAPGQEWQCPGSGHGVGRPYWNFQWRAECHMCRTPRPRLHEGCARLLPGSLRDDWMCPHCRPPRYNLRCVPAGRPCPTCGGARPPLLPELQVEELAALVTSLLARHGTAAQVEELAAQVPSLLAELHLSARVTRDVIPDVTSVEKWREVAASWTGLRGTADFNDAACRPPRPVARHQALYLAGCPAPRSFRVAIGYDRGADEQAILLGWLDTGFRPLRGCSARTDFACLNGVESETFLEALKVAAWSRGPWQGVSNLTPAAGWVAFRSKEIENPTPWRVGWAGNKCAWQWSANRDPHPVGVVEWVPLAIFGGEPPGSVSPDQGAADPPSQQSTLPDVALRDQSLPLQGAADPPSQQSTLPDVVGRGLQWTLPDDSMDVA